MTRSELSKIVSGLSEADVQRAEQYQKKQEAGAVYKPKYVHKPVTKEEAAIRDNTSPLVLNDDTSIITVLATAIAIIWFLLLLRYLLKKPFAFIAIKLSNCIAAMSKYSSVVALFWFFALRGRLTVRASRYLMALSQPDATPELANRLALSIDTYAAKQLLPETRYHLNEVFNGNRLALISEARLQGFSG